MPGDHVGNKITVRVDHEMVGDKAPIRSGLESLARGKHAKIRRRENSQEFLVRLRSSLGKNAVWRLPQGQRGFVSDKKAVRRRDDRPARRGLRHQIPFRDDFTFLILWPRRLEWSSHHSDIGL